MHTLLQGAIVLGLVVAGLRLRPAAALVLLVGTVVLLPSGLHLPTGVTAAATASRLTALAIAVGLVRQGQPGLWRSTPLSLAVGSYAALTLIGGLVLAPADLSLQNGVTGWLDLMDPVLIGAVALSCARAAGPRAVLVALGSVGLLAVAAGLVEHVSGQSLADRLVLSGPLETRVGSSRIRVGSDFALAFAWTMAALTPAVLGLLRKRAWLVGLGVGSCALMAYWSFSRSVPLGFAVGLAVLLLALRDRRTVALVLACGLALGSTALVPTVRSRFTAAVDQGALDVRFQRAPQVLDAVSERPVTGLGIGGVADLHVGETDESFLHTYAETGVLGLVSLLGVLVCGLVLVGRGVRGPPSLARTASGVCLAGAAVLIAAGTAFDVFAIRGTAALLGLMIGTGIAAAERVSGPAPRVRPGDLVRTRLAFVGLAVVAGVVLAQSWPTHVALTARFATLSEGEQAAPYDPVDVGHHRVTTVCEVAEAAHFPGVSIDCTDTYLAAGEGRLRLESRRESDLGAALFALVARVRDRTLVDDLVATPVLPFRSGRPSVVATAPWSAGLAALLLVLLLPSEPLRRLHARTRGWSWAVESGDGGARDDGPVGPPLRIEQQRAEGHAEAGQTAELQPLAAEPLRT
ncbi:MAG: O-Antigen ligase [Frankiales bacterium]|nr:O-Antigen ligase [Frankiales bacterium]